MSPLYSGIYIHYNIKGCRTPRLPRALRARLLIQRWYIRQWKSAVIRWLYFRYCSKIPPPPGPPFGQVRGCDAFIPIYYTFITFLRTSIGQVRSLQCFHTLPPDLHSSSERRLWCKRNYSGSSAATGLTCCFFWLSFLKKTLAILYNIFVWLVRWEIDPKKKIKLCGNVQKKLKMPMGSESFRGWWKPVCQMRKRLSG